jgi:hypothetical protein
MALIIPYPNTDRSLLTIEELRAAAGVTDDSRDAELQVLGDYVSSMITNSCNVPVSGAIPPTLRLETVTETFRVRTTGESVLFLARKPIVEIISVTEAGDAVVVDEYEVDGQGLYRLSSNETADWATGQAVIEYSAGYDIVPDDLKYIATRFFGAEWEISATGGGGGSSDRRLKRENIPGLGEREYWVPDEAETTHSYIIPSDVLEQLECGGYVYKWGWMR